MRHTDHGNFLTTISIGDLHCRLTSSIPSDLWPLSARLCLQKRTKYTRLFFYVALSSIYFQPNQPYLLFFYLPLQKTDQHEATQRSDLNDYHSCSRNNCNFLRHIWTDDSQVLFVTLIFSQSGTTTSCAQIDVSGARSQALHLKYLKSGVDWMCTIAFLRFPRLCSSVFTWVTRRRFSIKITRMIWTMVHSVVARSRTFGPYPKKLQIHFEMHSLAHYPARLQDSLANEHHENVTAKFRRRWNQIVFTIINM